MKLVAVPVALLDAQMGLLARGVEEYRKCSDSTMELGGPLVDPRKILLSGLASGGLQMLLMVVGEETIGYDLVSYHPDRIEGHQTWIAPEHRGKGHWRTYVQEIRALGKTLGLQRFQFTSTLEEWENRAPRLGLRPVQELRTNGVTATTWGVEV